ncbi:hypothetical protein T459_05180 [Capsicum annuum]|uniref:26S proteasome complex subunit SEM1 n=1 Tax=Capsicum annuum TaxID=4072 RepID=A0A2G3A759_CAPAN|nr:hypothetical protein T459_05180 [Capsicum annuum]
MATKQPTPVAEDVKMDLFENDDEFEEFAIDQEWEDKEEGKEVTQQWEDDWDDDDVKKKLLLFYFLNSFYSLSQFKFFILFRINFVTFTNC